MDAKQVKQAIRMVSILMEHLPEFFKLKTHELQWIIKNPKEAIVLFIKAIQNIKVDFSNWKSITIGTGFKTADDLRQAIKEAGGKVSDWAKDIMEKPDFTISPNEAEVDLVRISVAELGFENSTTLKKIYERAISMGLKLVSAEVGPQLRLQYEDQPMNKCLFMAMEPIKDSGGGLYVFGVGRGDDSPWLDASYGLPVGVWDSEYVFVFCK